MLSATMVRMTRVAEGSDGDEEAGDGVETPVGVPGPSLDRAESLD